MGGYGTSRRPIRDRRDVGTVGPMPTVGWPKRGNSLRRQFVADEVNALGTAWQRLDLLPTPEQADVRAAFRRYVDLLIDSYRNVSEPEGQWREPPALASAQTDTWRGAVAATASGVASERLLVLPALNDAFGAVERERLARRIHPPAIIFAMLGISALAAALFAGYGLANGRSRNWMYYLGIAATVSVAAYVVLELEYPRLGLVRVDSMDQALVELRSTMR